MLELYPQDFEFLSNQGTLVVPTAQRAAAVRLAYDVMQLRSGARAWATPRVLPWSAWLELGLDEARARGVEVPRRLSRVEAWWLWRDAVRAACVEDLAVLSPDGLVDAVRRAALLLEDYGVRLREPMTAEAAVLLQAQAAFNGACTERGALWSSSWRACAPFIERASATRLAGFDELGPARARWLGQIGVSGLEGGRAAVHLAPGASLPSVHALREPEQEARAAADWCAQRLEADPSARLLVVVPRLQEQRHRWLRAFARRFEASALLAAGFDPAHRGAGPAGTSASEIAIEGGAALSGYALIDLALRLLVTAAGEHDFAHLSAVLRSPYLGDADRTERLRIDLWLREQNVDPAAAHLPGLYEAMSRGLGEAAAARLRALLAPFEPPSEELAPWDSRNNAAQWARRFAQRLEQAGWPGSTLASPEQQQRVRFEELLGEMSALSEPASLEPHAAIALLRQLAENTAFEPATDDPPVTLTSDLADPIVRYDGIWVAGLTAGTWPESPRADPMIPYGVQRAAGMSSADPVAPLRRAERALRAWGQAARHLVLSYPQTEGDVRHDPSPLLDAAAGFGAAGREDDATPIAPPFDAAAWLAERAPGPECFADERGPAWPAGAPLRGGARLLELQALCPFRAFAELRLGARPLPEPGPGIAPMVRGQILHRALELFWSEIRDSSALRARREELIGLARGCVERALHEANARVPGGLDGRLVRHEADRNVRLLEGLIEWELTRDPFEVAFLEKSETYASGTAGLSLRVDRIDRLADGNLIIFDYKTGRPETFRAHEERPRRPQLPAYAVVTGARAAAVTALYLTREGLRLRGAADRDGRLPGLKAPAPELPDWTTLLERWRGALDGLLEEFLTGDARVQPLPDACGHCHLRLACRVRAESGIESPGESAEAEES